jgi:hypothetical protein
MSKIIKIKQKDIENIVENLVREQEEVNDKLGGLYNSEYENELIVTHDPKKPGVYYFIDAKTNQLIGDTLTGTILSPQDLKR